MIDGEHVAWQQSGARRSANTTRRGASVADRIEKTTQVLNRTVGGGVAIG